MYFRMDYLWRLLSGLINLCIQENGDTFYFLLCFMRILAVQDIYRLYSRLKLCLCLLYLVYGKEKEDGGCGGGIRLRP